MKGLDNLLIDGGDHGDEMNRMHLNQITNVSELNNYRLMYQFFPVDSIDCNSDENYRKNIKEEEIRNLGDSITNYGVQQPIALYFSSVKYAQIEQIINSNGDVSELLAIENPKLIFGFCRYAAVTQYTDLKNIPVWLYGLEADPFVRTLRLIENLDRKDPCILDTAVEIYHCINQDYSGKIADFIKSSEDKGKSIYPLYSVGKACLSHDAFKTFVEKQDIVDIETLGSLSKAILEDAGDTRKKKVLDFFKQGSVISKKLSKIRDSARLLNSYAKGKTNKIPEITDKNEFIQKSTENSEHTKNPQVRSKPSSKRNAVNKAAKSLISALSKSDQPLDDESIATLQTVIEKINTRI